MLRLPRIKSKPHSEEHTALKSSFLLLHVGEAPFSLLCLHSPTITAFNQHLSPWQNNPWRRILNSFCPNFSPLYGPAQAKGERHFWPEFGSDAQTQPGSGEPLFRRRRDYGRSLRGGTRLSPPPRREKPRPGPAAPAPLRPLRPAPVQRPPRGRLRGLSLAARAVPGGPGRVPFPFRSRPVPAPFPLPGRPSPWAPLPPPRSQGPALGPAPSERFRPGHGPLPAPPRGAPLPACRAPERCMLGRVVPAGHLQARHVRARRGRSVGAGHERACARWPGRPVASWLVTRLVWPAGTGQGSPPVLSTDEAAPRVLWSVLGLSINAHMEALPAVRSRITSLDEGPGGSWSTSLMRSSWESWGNLPWRREGSVKSLWLSTTLWNEVNRWGQPLLPGSCREDTRHWPQAAPGEVPVGHQGEFFHRKGFRLLEWTARRGGGVPMSRGV